MAYSNPQEVWTTLGKDSYTKIRTEVVGTGNGTTSLWSLDHDDVISDSLVLYTNSGIVSTASYTTDLDDGDITYTASSGSVLTADYDYADLPDSRIVSLISSSDAMIEADLGRVFTSTSTSEYYNYDSETLFLRNYPVITISSIECNVANSVYDSPSWNTLAEGLGNDYLANTQDLLIGRIRFIDTENMPLVDEDGFRVTYSYGYSTTPTLVNELSILLTIRQMINSAVYKSIFKGQDNFTPVRLAEIENRIIELKRLLRKTSIDRI